jgi:hypothetical protein
MNKVFPVNSDETRPTCFRINYSAILLEFKIFIFGGLDTNLKCLNILDSFDVTTYKWEKVLTKGKIPPGRHSHSAVEVNNKMYIIGGNTSSDLFLKDDLLDDIYYLDLNNMHWT